MMCFCCRLDRVFSSAEQITLKKDARVIIFSDCHRGYGGSSDEFASNQLLFFHALNYYYEGDFIYIEAGDGDELWENSDFEIIRKVYDHIYWRMQNFYDKERLFLIWGNHNDKWREDREVREHLDYYFDEQENYEQWEMRGQLFKAPKDQGERGNKRLFKGIKVHEGIKLLDKESGLLIFITHGHQGSLFDDRLRWLGQRGVRFVWKPLQLMGVSDPTSPARDFKRRAAAEQRMTEWAAARKQMIIVGHTHRSVFSRPGKSPYYNCGSCVQPRCITGFEIENSEIRLVKWQLGYEYDPEDVAGNTDKKMRQVKDKAPVYIKREILDQCLLSEIQHALTT